MMPERLPQVGEMVQFFDYTGDPIPHAAVIIVVFKQRIGHVGLVVFPQTTQPQSSDYDDSDPPTPGTWRRVPDERWEKMERQFNAILNHLNFLAP